MNTNFYWVLLKDNINKNKILNVKIIGNSMMPEIEEGNSVDLILANDYKIGDILAYRYENSLVIHRLLKIRNLTYICKGDNSFRLEHIKKDEIIGKVEHVYKNGLKQAVRATDLDFLYLSYKVGIEFIKCEFNVNKIFCNKYYLDYRKKYLKND